MALSSLLVKLGNSNVQLFLKYRLLKAQPHLGTNWVLDHSWALQYSHRLKPGSKVWNKIGQAWKTLVKEVSYRLLQYTK